MEKIENGYCSTCSTKFEALVWPRECKACGAVFWDNPKPVVVSLVPVIEGGALIGLRGENPGAGKWNLLGGYIEKPHDWRANGGREIDEESNGRVIIDHRRLQPIDVYSPDDARNILIFAISHPIHADSIVGFVPTKESLALKIVHEPVPLAFRSHTDILRRYFEGEFEHALQKTRPR